MTTITATAIRMILSALLPPVEGGGAGGITVEGGAGVAATAADCCAPHLLQNFIPSLSVAPQELQNAITHLKQVVFHSNARVYRRLAAKAVSGFRIELVPGSCAVVGHGKHQQNEEEEYRRDNDHL